MGDRLFFIGDSFVNGTGDPDCLGWVGRVCAAAQASGAEFTVYNLGVRKDTTSLIAQRWQQEAQCRLVPDHSAAFVFSFGANDVDGCDGQRRVPLAQSLDNAQAILSGAQSWGPVRMVGSPPIADDPEANLRLATLCQGIEAICQSLDIPFLGTLEPLLASPTWMAEAIAQDGAHPGRAGYSQLAELILAWPAWQAWFPQASQKGSQRDRGRRDSMNDGTS